MSIDLSTIDFEALLRRYYEGLKNKNLLNRAYKFYDARKWWQKLLLHKPYLTEGGKQFLLTNALVRTVGAITQEHESFVEVMTILRTLIGEERAEK